MRTRISLLDWQPGHLEVSIKRFLLISGIYPPDVGGPATYIPKLAEYLVEQGHMVTVFSLSDDKQKNPNSEVWSTQFVSRKIPLPLRIIVVAFRITMLAFKSDFVFANGLHQEVAISRKFVKRPSLAKIVGDPVWERYRNSSSKNNLSIEDFSNTQHTLSTRLQREFLRWSLNRFDLVTAPGEGLIQLMHKWHVKAPTILIENGTRCSSELSTKVIYDSISVSRLVPWKNLDFFVRSAALGDLKIAICGDGPEKARLEILSQTLRAKVDFLGELDSAGVRRALQSSKTFVNISSYEGLSFSLIEAMMEAKACIVSDIKGNTDVIEDRLNGIVVALGSPEELTRAIRECVNNQEYASQLGKEARKIAQSNYCEETQLKKMMITLMGLE